MVAMNDGPATGACPAHRQRASQLSRDLEAPAVDSCARKLRLSRPNGSRLSCGRKEPDPQTKRLARRGNAIPPYL